ncbi:MAG TPA: ABC transporter substrate binding protein [Candidatus Acidoferrum sp.]|nr:ABC transporter substrate binding protein [Candidatus Acidoferrum sp.]
MRNLRYFTILLPLIITIAIDAQGAPRKFVIGFFEPGGNVQDASLRGAVRDEMEKLAPADMTLLFSPDAFRSAAWNRDTCRLMAKQLATMPGVDLILAVGPWVVGDLLAAGCTKPIVAIDQAEPGADDLAGKDGRPVASNVTFQRTTGKIEADLAALRRLIKFKRLGVLSFSSENEPNRLVDSITALGKLANIEVFTATGYNKYHTYAFFKAFQALEKKIDALYVGQLWGLDDPETYEFLLSVARAKIPVFAASDRSLVARGAFASATGSSFLAAARFSAWKALKILGGAKPVDLPVELPEAAVLTINEGVARECQVSVPDELLAEANVVEAPIDATVDHFSLPDAVARALDQNPGYLAKYEALNAAAAAAASTGSVYLPRISAYGQAAHVDNNSVYNHFGEIQNDSYAAGLQADLDLFSLSAIRTVQLNAMKKDVTRLDAETAALDLAFGVTTAYMNYLKAAELLTVAVGKRYIIDEFAGVTSSRMACGEGDTLESSFWRQERLKATSDLVMTRANLKVARVLLNVLLNRPGNEPLTVDSVRFSDVGLLDDYGRLRPFLEGPNAVARIQDFFTREAVRQNPEVRRVDTAITMQKLRLSLNSAQWYPSLGVHAGFSLIDSLADRAPTFAEKHHTWELSANVRVPLFDGGVRTRERRTLNAEMNGLEYQRDASRLEAMGRIQQAVYESQAGGRAAELAIGAGRLASQNLAEAANRYDEGSYKYSDIAAILDRSTTLQHLAIVSRFDYFLSQARLVHDIGWAPQPENGTPGDQLYQKLAKQYGQPRTQP